MNCVGCRSAGCHAATLLTLTDCRTPGNTNEQCSALSTTILSPRMIGILVWSRVSARWKSDDDLLDSQVSWGGSSAGRASRSQCEGREFDPPPLHHPHVPRRLIRSETVQKALENQRSGAFFLSRSVPCNSDSSVFTLQELLQEPENMQELRCGVPAWPTTSSHRTPPSRR
jgi:hypothetical protein